MQILAVVVRYKTPIEESETMNSLATEFRTTPVLLNEVGVFVWDNSPERLWEPAATFPFDYIHSERNRGLSAPYNEAAKVAERMGCAWLLLLDQDTVFPDGFLHRMLEYSRSLDANADIAAILPTIWVDSRYVLPRRVCFNHTESLDPSFSGASEVECTSANSGALMRISALQQIGGYSEDFTQDFSDMYIFHQLHRAGKKVWIAGDLRLDHKMTIFDFDGSMTPDRYLLFMGAEDEFISNYKSAAENIVQTARLLARSVRQYRGYINPAYSRISLRYFWRRLFYSKAARARAWKATRLALIEKMALSK
jgi:GT2 family glycosyltransferase